MKDFYYILGIDVNCTPDEVREAYRKLSKKFHPDLNQNDNYFENRFKDIRQAYETLNDPITRKDYDAAFKKSKSALEKEPKKRSYANTTKSIDIAFSIMLIIFTLLFGDYVVKTITSAKKAKAASKTIIVETDDAPVIKPHKKKHGLKIKPADASVMTKTEMRSVEPIAENRVITIPKTEIKPAVAPTPVAAPVVTAQPIVKAEVKPVKFVSVPVAAAPVQPTPIVNVAKRETPVIADNTITSAYYIKPNSTGVVYMRMADNYASAVVSVIPGNSRVAVLEKGSSFYKVSFNNKTGYVPKWTVKAD